MRKALLVIPLLISVASSGFFSDFLKGIFNSDKGKDEPGDPFSRFLAALPIALLDQLENDEQQAGQFVCAIRNGDIPGALEDLGTDVWDDIQAGFDEVASFIESLPSIPIEIFENIISDGEGVVSVVEELFTDPGGVVTLVENDVKTVISDIESVAESLWHGLTCLFKHCTMPNPAATLSSSCGKIMAAATTTWSPAASSTTYAPAQPTNTQSPTMAPQTSTIEPAAKTVTKSASLLAETSTPREAAQTTTKTVSQAAQSTSQEVEPAAITSSTTAQDPPEPENTQTSSSGSGSGGAVVPSDGMPVFILQIWVGVLVFLLIMIVL